jgi:hypothetical protein
MLEKKMDKEGTVNKRAIQQRLSGDALHFSGTWRLQKNHPDHSGRPFVRFLRGQLFGGGLLAE